MGDTKAEEIIKRQELLAGRRRTWDTHWEDIARYVLPRSNDFFGNKSPGQKRTDDIYDTTAATALGRFAAVMDNLLTPRNSQWHGVRVSDDDLHRVPQVREWFDTVTKIMFRERYAPEANFASQKHEEYLSLGAFGTGCLYVDDDIRRQGMGYKSIYLGEIYIDENQYGIIDLLYRKYKLNARQAIAEFGEEKLPDTIVKKAEKDPFEEYEFIHCVSPNKNYDPSRAGIDFMRFNSAHVSLEGSVVVREGGYKTWPYPVSRYVTSSNEIYGRSVAMAVLPGIKMLNQMKKTDIRASHLAIAPPLLIPDDGVITSVDIRPEKIIAGGLSRDGKRMIEPLISGARLDISEVKMENERNAINDEFLVNMFQILIDTPQMTATEVLERAREKGALLTPTVGRQESEALGPLIEREFQILFDSGKFPEMPPELLEAEGDYEIEYTSPLSKAQKSDEAFGTIQTVQVAFEAAAFDPTVLDPLNLDEYVRTVGDAHGVPEKLWRHPDEVAEIRSQRAEQEEAAAMAEAAPGLAQAGLNAARMSKTQQEVDEG